MAARPSPVTATQSKPAPIPTPIPSGTTLAAKPSAAVNEQQAGDPAERRDGKTFAARHDDVLAQLQGAARDAHDHKRLQDTSFRTAQLVTEEDRDPEHQLDLLLERVDGLAGHRSDGEDGAQSRRDRCCAADRTGGGDPAPRGTDERQGKLIVGVRRVSGAQLVNLGTDRRLAALHCLIEGADHETDLWRELIEIHGGEAYRTVQFCDPVARRVARFEYPLATLSR